LGDSTYISSTGKFYVALGIIGCNPISVDNVIVQDVNTCYGDSTGSLQILATGGFGAPWVYSIDNLESSSEVPYFGDLPAGDYPIVVVDKEGCTQTGPIENVSQPDTLEIQLVSSSDITLTEDGSIVVSASGGTSPYRYTLMPNSLIQDNGIFTFGTGESGKYLVWVNDDENCGPVATDTIEIEEITGVNDLLSKEAKVYPNPTSSMFTLEMPFEGSDATLEVLSLTGQVMISRQVYSTSGEIRENINVSELAKGMYMLRVDGLTLRSGIVVN